MKDKKTKTTLNGFIGIVNQSKRKPNKLSFSQGTELYNNLLQKLSDDIDVFMYTIYNEGNSLVWKLSRVRFIKNDSKNL